MLSEKLRRDSLGDLLHQLPASPQGFLRQAVARFERAGHVYTSAEEGCRIWTAPAGGKVQVHEADTEITLPSGSAAVYDFTDGRYRPDLYEEVLREAMQREFASAAGIQRIYTWIRPAEHDRRKTLEGLGFVPAGAVRKATRAGRVALETPRLK